MSRIKKRGLDYFPMNTDFIQDRLVRRILKREGDAALAVLLQTYCSIYSGEGYYVLADSFFYDDMADCLYQQEATDAERIINLAVTCGLFDATLFGKHHILTSADIQSQFLFITKRRSSTEIDARYNLLPIDETNSSTPADKTRKGSIAPKTIEDNEVCNEADVTKNVTENNENAYKNNQTVTFKTQNNENTNQRTQSIAKQSTEKQSIENPLLKSSPEIGGTDFAARKPAKEEEEKEEESSSTRMRKTSHEWTDEEISLLTPPHDGFRRNLDGLIFNLRQLHIPLTEQYAIILKSNFGIIGHPMWEGFSTLRNSHGKIRQPGRYLLSLCKPTPAKT